jgi:hypothetical protein
MAKLTDESRVKPTNLAYEDFDGQEEPQILWRVLFWETITLEDIHQKNTKRVRMTKYFMDKEYCDAWIEWLKERGAEIISCKQYILTNGEYRALEN